MRQLPTTILIALLVAGGSAAADHGNWVRHEDDDVWVKWNAVRHLETKAMLENATIEIDAGYEAIFFVDVYNNHTEPIHNVTLVPQPFWADLELTFEETYVGDPPQGIYAFFGEIEPKSNGLAVMGFRAPDATGPWMLRFQVHFEGPAGEQRFGTTTFHGDIVEPSGEKSEWIELKTDPGTPGPPSSHGSDAVGMDESEARVPPKPGAGILESIDGPVGLAVAFLVGTGLGVTLPRLLPEETSTQESEP